MTSDDEMAAVMKLNGAVGDRLGRVCCIGKEKKGSDGG